VTGRFITFEGGEGCGKSTQIRLLGDRLRAAGKEVLLTREPGGTALAERIRALVREESGDPPNARAETLLFLASRAQVVESVIRPALAAGVWVLCDRFADSTFAYQGYGRGFDLQELKRLNAFATGGLVPDRTVLLDVSPDAAAARMRAREQATHTVPDRMEKAGDAFHARLKRGFLEMAAAEPERFVVIAADGGVDEVAEDVWNSIRPMI
jgi:dTMP kinase